MKCAKDYLLEREKMSQKVIKEIRKDTIRFIEEVLSPYFDTEFLQHDECLLPHNTIREYVDCKISYFKYKTINYKVYKIDFTFLKIYLKTYCINATLLEAFDSTNGEKCYDIKFSLNLNCLEQ